MCLQSCHSGTTLGTSLRVFDARGFLILTYHTDLRYLVCKYLLDRSESL